MSDTSPAPLKADERDLSVRKHQIAWRSSRRRAGRVLHGQLISLVGLLHRPILDPDGAPVGHVDDVAIRWTTHDDYPPVVGILTRVGRALVLISIDDADITQTEVRLRTSRVSVDKPVRQAEHMALARDVLDSQLVDISGVQVVRAADVYLVVASDRLRLAGVDVSPRAFFWRVLPFRPAFRPPGRLVGWAQLQAFAPRSVDDPTEPHEEDPTSGAGTVGRPLRLAVSAGELQAMGPVEVARVLPELGRDARSQLVRLAEPLTAAAALESLHPDARDALLSALGPADRTRLEALIAEEPGT